MRLSGTGTYWALVTTNEDQREHMRAYSKANKGTRESCPVTNTLVSIAANEKPPAQVSEIAQSGKF